MIRTTLPARSVTALAGIAGMMALAGCAGTSGDASRADASDGVSADASAYADGTYSAEGSYQTPRNVETIAVTLSLAGGIVNAVEVIGAPTTRETTQFQAQFIEGIADEVVGVAIEDLKVSRVAGSSLTSGGFNQALEAIKEQAAN